MKDFTGRDIFIGDEIVYSRGRQALQRAVIVEFTQKNRGKYEVLDGKIKRVPDYVPAVKVLHLNPDGKPALHGNSGMLEAWKEKLNHACLIKSKE